MRKRLKEMAAQERREWAEQKYAELCDFRAYVQRYLDRRKGNQARGRGRRTETDERYDQFQVLATDILGFLDFVVFIVCKV
jgi:hypothetical protein